MKKAIFTAMVVLLAALATLSYSQSMGRGQRGGGFQGGPGGPGGFDREAMQQRMYQMMKEQLEISDEEWTITGPRLTKVMELNRETNGMGGMGRMMFARNRGRMGQGGGMGRPGQPEGEELSDVQKATEALNTVLEAEKVEASAIKEKLTALRAAKEKARQDLIKAQEELKEVLTLKQEAKLVMFGMLD